MHTQLNCQSKQTNTHKINLHLEKSNPSRLRSPRCSKNQAAKCLVAGGMETSPRRRGPSIEESRGARGSRASSPLATRSSGAWESGNLPFFRHFYPGLCRSPFPYKLHAAGSWWHRGSARDLGTATATPRLRVSRKQRLQPAEVPRGGGFGVRLPSLPMRVARPRQEII